MFWRRKRKEDKWLDELDAKLDAREKALDERIAGKEAYYEQLYSDVEVTYETVKNLQDTVDRYEKAIKRSGN